MLIAAGLHCDVIHLQMYAYIFSMRRMHCSLLHDAMGYASAAGILQVDT